MERLRIKDIAEMRDIPVEVARVWISKQIDAGRWARTKNQGQVYYVQLSPDVDWHDIFNLRSRKPGLAFDEYRRIRDEKVYS